MIVSGVSSSNKYFVAINDAPQNKTAKIGSQYLYDFVLMILKFIQPESYSAEFKNDDD